MTTGRRSLVVPSASSSATARLPLDGHTAVGPGWALLLAGVLSAALAVGCTRGRTPTGACSPLLLAGIALLPTTMTGHAASSADHELAVSSLVVHVLAALLWLAASAWRAGPPVPPGWDPGSEAGPEPAARSGDQRSTRLHS